MVDLSRLADGPRPHRDPWAGSLGEAVEFHEAWRPSFQEPVAEVGLSLEDGS